MIDFILTSCLDLIECDSEIVNIKMGVEARHNNPHEKNNCLELISYPNYWKVEPEPLIGITLNITQRTAPKTTAVPNNFKDLGIFATAESESNVAL